VKARRCQILACLLAVGLIAGVSGCDLGDDADLDNGRELFVAQCGTCHQLAEAATTSDIGPDLDAAFAAARDNGMGESTIEGVVNRQIEIPRKTEPDDPTYMPANLVTGDDAKDVSAYVAAVAGVPGAEPPQAPGGPGGQVFANNGCGACHVFGAAQSQGQVGPNLDETLAGQDADYIEQQIVDPNSEITPPFEAGIMPENYDETISPEDLELLVEFLQRYAGQDYDPAEEGGAGEAGAPGQAGSSSG
jgi:mono/diheme cytochrome c family protein